MYEGSGRTGCQEKLEAATHLQSLIFCVIWSGYLYFQQGICYRNFKTFMCGNHVWFDWQTLTN